MPITVTGTSEAQAALRAIATRAQHANRNTVRDVGFAIEAEAKRQLTTSSHTRDTATPSSPGEPPSLVSGNLRRSVLTRGPTGSGPAATISVGPTAIYSRIQELGGTAGHGAQLPARPYLTPAAEHVMGQVMGIAARNWAGVVGG